MQIFFSIKQKDSKEMLDEKEKIKMEFDFLKWFFLVLLVVIFGIIAYVFINLGKISFFAYVVCFFALSLLSYICFKIFSRIQKIIKN